MYCKKIKYKNFRNINDAEIIFSKGVNVLVGNNAEGKTNALEGIYLMATGKSFRTVRERELVKFGEDYFENSLLYEDVKRENELYYKGFSPLFPKKRECKKNGVNMKVSEFIGNFRAVLFCPEHLSIVKDGPSERRGFLDIALCQIRPLYLKSLQRFQKILSERNALLKSLSENSGDKGLLEIYSDQLARECAAIMKCRYEYIKRLDSFVKRFFSELSEITGVGEKESPKLIYKNSLKTEERLSEMEAYDLYFKKLTENTAAEIGAGVTLYGSHKDDIEIYLGEKEARSFSSQGQQRSMALAMKLGEGEISMEYTGEYPVFLFDDVLSELDIGRQKFLLSSLKGRQVIMTTCVMPENLEDGQLINVKEGKYECTFTQETINF